MRSRTAPYAALAMLVCGASGQPAIAVGAPSSAPVTFERAARPWKLSCTNGVTGMFAAAFTPAPLSSPRAQSVASSATASPQRNSVVLRDGTVNAASAAWKTSFGRGVSSPPQQCTLALHKAPLSTLRYTLSGARPLMMTDGPGGTLAELVLTYINISIENLQVTR